MIRTAFKFIRFDKPKSIGIIVGIVISIFLIGQQLGTLRYLTSLMAGVVNSSNTSDEDIWIIDQISQNINALSPIDSRITQEVRSIPGVKNSYNIVIANAAASFAQGNTVAVNLIGSDAPQFIAGPNPNKIISGELQHLNLTNAFSAEFFNAKNFGVPIQLDQTFEINKKQAIVKIITKNAQGFGAYLLYSSIQNARFYGNFPADKVSIIVVKIHNPSEKEAIIQQINQIFYGVKAWDVHQLAQASISNILISSNMGISFGSLVIFAVISGFFIIGLTLYSAALDRLTDYGTLKAIGASHAYVSRLIITQALLFALIGYSIALLLLYGFKTGVAKSGLIIQLDFSLCALLLGITLFMSIGGSLFAVFKIRKLEPASIF